ncbi:S-methyl-5-thioribose kinase [Clostridium estertheticum]|uniref:S-methyl-5-thioribose kinase n=1 Tax=Clostridium estertheticum TaxID=238834 RepID=UPI001CF565B2|nr:S-methyl-5-thioribose kinase [Clostridium estertheticum]MCB2362323.1 S-methyl-5-thioribose kinase [Clostridium estertheticum]
MSIFTEGYFTMNEIQALDYATSVLNYFDLDADLSCKEIGDGNLNYVFRIIDSKSEKSIIIKQAGPFARISDEFNVSPDRNRIESDILKLQYTLAEGFVPKVYNYDSIMNCTAMEDLSDHVIMRQALIDHKKFPLFADHITTFIVNTLLLTSDVVMNHKDKKELIKNFINPDLCEITEDLVYTEPFYDCTRNDVIDATREFAQKELWGDEKLLLETAKLKFEFMTNAQSLIHGDLHTGSIFVKENSTKVIDPEFAFYGPAGYDLGNLIGNLIFAYENAEATIDDLYEKKEYKDWLEETIVQVVDLFIFKFNALWIERVTEETANYKGFKEYYIGNILKDTAAITGCELCRRIIGLAHVKDITSINNIEKRARAEKICLSSGKKFIMSREIFKTGADFIKIVKEFENNIN